MNYSTVNILALPDEMLLAILNKLNNMDVLYSFIGVNQRLDRLVRDITFTQSVDLVTISSNEHNESRNKSILDRFCFSIIPRIQHNIECLTLDPLSIDRTLHIEDYPKLHKLTLVNLQLETVSRIFIDDSSFIYIVKHHLSHLTLMINENSAIDENIQRQFSTYVFTTILRVFTNLTYLHFGLDDIFLSSPRSLDLLYPTRYASNIIHLNVKVSSFNDCLCLVDGRLSQLHTFIVQIYRIRNTSMIINNMKTVSNLKHFSLSSFCYTMEYDNQIVPCLRQMTQLEKLTLSILVYGRASFINGTHLVNDILSKMSHLHTFNFNIITRTTIMNERFLPTSDDVRRALIERGYNVECYTGYGRMHMGQCHIYSLPFIMERMDTFTNKFPDGLFMTVRHLVVHDLFRPFEHEFFVRISQACPLLNKLEICNENEQYEHKQKSSIIEFSHLMILNLSRSALDYAEQFLFDFNTHLPCLNTLHIKYIDLAIVTKNFTNDAARANCSKLQHIIFDSTEIIYPENFSLYFPLF